MSPDIYLKDLENRIDVNEENGILNSWKDFIENRFKGEIFLPKRSRSVPEEIKWPEISINSTLDDFDRMALQQYALCSHALVSGNGEVLSIRCNYGTGILPSLFGAELFIMDESLNTLPTTRPLAGGVDAVKALLDKGVPNPRNGLGGKTFTMAERFMETGRKFPLYREVCPHISS